MLYRFAKLQADLRKVADEKRADRGMCTSNNDCYLNWGLVL